ncbi:uncharacterized protein LOC120626995 isoform X1 [Pararge aegeria]|nr:uncharacterized protein LOC120626995 isoform X1 [Pararge aegeria]
MSKTCEFGTGLQESLRDQLVCGIKSEIIRQRLFAENKLDFAKAYNLAVSLEAAEKDAAMVVGNAKASGETSAVECQAVYSGRSRRLAGAARGQRGWRAASRGRAAAASSGPRSQQGCQACGGAHEESGCNFKAYVCRVCMRRGHIRRVCPNITPHNTVDVTQCNKQAGQDSDSGSDEVILIDINQVDISECKPIYIPIIIHSKAVKMECDTGSAVSCVSEDVYNRYFGGLPIKQCRLALRYYTGEIVKPIGVITPQVEYKGTKKLLDLYIVKNGKSMLLGRQWIAALDISIQSVTVQEVHNLNSCNFDLNVFSSRYYNVFADGLGRFTGEPEHRVKIGKHHINYIKVGHGPHSCILTPGGLGTIWTNYKPQIEGFDRSKFTLVVWDPPGFGKSYPPEREFTSDSYGNDADTGYELMKILGIPRFSVLGWSAGGSASLVLAAKHPDAVRKLVVWGANAYILPTEIAAYRKIADVNTWAKHLRVPMVEVYGKERFAQYWARWVDCMSVALEAKMDICSEHLKNIKCPTLVLHGCKDPLVDPVHAPYLIENIKKSVLYIYTDGKHDIHIRHAEDFNKRVQDFLLEPAKNDIECH